jgi:hypothetical protein
MVFYDCAEDPVAFANTVRHEAIHAHLDQVACGLVPRWIHEGFATYFSGDPGEEELEEQGNLYHVLIQEAIRTGTAPTLWDLLQPRVFGDTEYAASWSLIDLFLEDRELGSRFESFLRDWIKENRKERSRPFRTKAKGLQGLVELMQHQLNIYKRLNEHGALLLEALGMEEQEVMNRWREHFEKKAGKPLSPGQKIAQAHALAKLAWLEMKQPGLAAAARASSLLARAEENLSDFPETIDTLDGLAADRLLKAHLKVAKAYLAHSARIRPKAVAEQGEAVLAAAGEWSERRPDDAVRQFHAGHALAECAYLLMEELEQDIQRIGLWSGTSAEATGIIAAHRLNKIERAIASLDDTWGRKEAMQKYEAFKPVIEELAGEGAAMLTDALLLQPPHAEATGSLCLLALAAAPEALPDAREALDFLLKVDPSDCAHVWAAQFCLHEGSHAGATQHIQEALKLEPGQPDATALKEELGL